eukprot:gnl/MRDRNA2_/MRDRNA2_120791_c0_seq1.p1 gnl/MRDRNA2_/MRDRNA2_120791_c0~~gnl/MRDRNA2_/MRDRNA2_120791_c0_seq1.p1  ORF type:complete len:355 (+),score=65.56 gnl/MRDRNA2_/MRDRNA2_120791_c0_seq1:95-1159(+)
MKETRNMTGIKVVFLFLFTVHRCDNWYDARRRCSAGKPMSKYEVPLHTNRQDGESGINFVKGRRLSSTGLPLEYWKNWEKMHAQTDEEKHRKPLKSLRDRYKGQQKRKRKDPFSERNRLKIEWVNGKKVSHVRPLEDVIGEEKFEFNQKKSQLDNLKKQERLKKQPPTPAPDPAELQREQQLQAKRHFMRTGELPGEEPGTYSFLRNIPAPTQTIWEQIVEAKQERAEEERRKKAKQNAQNRKSQSASQPKHKKQTLGQQLEGFFDHPHPKKLEQIEACSSDDAEQRCASSDPDANELLNISVQSFSNACIGILILLSFLVGSGVAFVVLFFKSMAWTGEQGDLSFTVKRWTVR